MLNASWATLLRQIPADQHNTLMLRTNTGIEVNVQDLLRIDYEFVIFKGRLAGTQDAGRLFILPYTNIDYFGINRFVKDEEFQALFAGVVLPDPDGDADVPASGVLGTPQPATPLPVRPSAAEAQPTTPMVLPSRMGMVVKSSVLERFRTRNTANGNGPRPTDE